MFRRVSLIVGRGRADVQNMGVGIVIIIEESRP